MLPIAAVVAVPRCATEPSSGNRPKVPTAIGYVPLWQSQLFVMRLREEGFHAHAIDDVRISPMGRIPVQPMSTIHVPACEAAAARGRLDEMSAS